MSQKIINSWFKKIRTPEVLLLLVLLLFSMSFRLWYMSRNLTFSQDQARDVLIAEEYLATNPWLIGYGPKASVGDFYLPPLYYYLQTFVRFISPWPLSMAVLITIVESLTPVLLYLLLKKFYSSRAAVTASLLYVVSPLATAFGTFMWNPNMIPFFSVLALYSFLQAYVKEKKWWLSVCLISVTIAFHLHYQAFILIPFFAVATLWLLLRKRMWLPALVGAILSVLTFLPYVWVESQQNFHNTRAVYEYWTRDHTVIYDRVSKPAYFLSFMPEFFGRILVGEAHYWQAYYLGRVVFWGGHVLAGIWFLYLFKSRPKESKTRVLFWLLAYMASMYLILRLYKGDKIDYYMSILFPFPAILIGMLADLPWIRKLILPLVGIYLFWMSLWYARTFYQPKNTYAELVEVSDFVNTSVHESASTYILLHHKDMTNVLRYARQHLFSIQEVDQLSSASTLVQLCYTGQPCTPFQDDQCRDSIEVEKVGLADDLSAGQKVWQSIGITRGAYTLLVSEIR